MPVSSPTAPCFHINRGFGYVPISCHLKGVSVFSQHWDAHISTVQLSACAWLPRLHFFFFSLSYSITTETHSFLSFADSRTWETKCSLWLDFICYCPFWSNHFAIWDMPGQDSLYIQLVVTAVALLQNTVQQICRLGGCQSKSNLTASMIPLWTNMLISQVIHFLF